MRAFVLLRPLIPPRSVCERFPLRHSTLATLRHLPWSRARCWSARASSQVRGDTRGGEGRGSTPGPNPEGGVGAVLARLPADGVLRAGWGFIGSTLAGRRRVGRGVGVGGDLGLLVPTVVG